MRKNIALLGILTLLFCAAAAAEGTEFLTVPDVLRPGKAYMIRVSAPAEDAATLSLNNAAGEAAFVVFDGYPLSPGENTLYWDGMTAEQLPVSAGEYVLTLRLSSGGEAVSPLRVGAPYPLITDIRQSDGVLSDAPVEITYHASEAGTVEATLLSYADGTERLLTSMSVREGENGLAWSGEADGQRVEPGMYAVVLTLKNAVGALSMPHQCMVEVVDPDAAAQAHAELIEATPPPAAATPAPTPAPQFSAPYSQTVDNTFWSMTPGETDDAKIWEILTQPITVYDGGLDAKPKVHAFAMSNPDGTGEQVIQIHAQSQALHVIGEPNEHGYVLVEAFSNYDENYNPKTDEERATAFDLKQGYVLARNLKTVEVSQHQGIVIDKLTQRLYLYIDGVRVTELLVATGKIADGKYYNETIPGEYITISRTGGFASGNMYCDMAIRINGGILLHEVPFKTNADGTKNYSAFEAYLGTKQSHGCIRIQRLKNDEGYNHAWLWKNIKLYTKVIIWDDLNRVDSPAVEYPNP